MKISQFQLNLHKYKFTNLTDVMNSGSTVVDAANLSSDTANVILIGNRHRRSVIYPTSSSDVFNVFSRLMSILSRYSHNTFIVIPLTDNTFTLNAADVIPDNVNIHTSNIGDDVVDSAYFNTSVFILPLGLDYGRNYVATVKEKSRLCYSNFSIDTNITREYIYHNILGKQFIDFEFMGNWGSYSLSNDDYINKLSTYKFAISPEGAGIDNFRTYECIINGVIPIVERSRYMEQLSLSLPIHIVDNFADITEENLNVVYNNMHNKDDFNFNILSLQHLKNIKKI